MFDDPKRDDWQKPNEVIEALALPADAVVADIGAGTGYFAVRLARLLPKGKVYAADLEPEMVRTSRHARNATSSPTWLPCSRTWTTRRLPQTVDVALFVNVVHHIDGRESYFGA